MQCIIGDIHGCLDDVLVLEKALQDHFQEIIQITFTGDLVDRGPDSRGVVEYLRQHPHATGVLGNHDDMLLSAISLLRPDLLAHHPPLFDISSELFLSEWKTMGGNETLQSYGIKRLPQDLDLIPSEHIAFLRSLPLFREDSHTMVSHAVADKSTIEEVYRDTLSPKTRFQLLWNRDVPQKRIDPHRLHVSGHTVVAQPTLIAPGFLLIDTGCVFGYRLSAYCPQTREIISVQHGTRDIRRDTLSL